MKISLRADKETILRLLKSTDIAKKLKVFGSLDQLSEKDRIRVLLRILEDGSWSLREKATRELAAYGARILPRLIRICEKGIWFSRAAACITLGRIGDERAVLPLAGLILTDDNPTVLKEAEAALLAIARTRPEAFARELSRLAADDTPRLLIRLRARSSPLLPVIRERPGGP
jgi:HEAT repeat protein